MKKEMSLLKLQPLRKKNSIFLKATKNLNNQKGSTLVMVLIFASILSILGVALLSASITNMKLKLADQKMKKSFYTAEAGIEEAHARIEKQVKDAIDYADKIIEKNLEDKNDYSDYTNDDGSVDQTKLKNKMKTWFKSAYISFLNNESIDPDNEIFKNFTKTDEGYEDYEYAELRDKLQSNTNNYQLGNMITIAKIVKFGENQDTYDLYIESNSNNDVNKKVSKKFSIKIPEYNEISDENIDQSYYRPYYIGRDTEYLYSLKDIIGDATFKDNAVTSLGNIIVEEEAQVRIGEAGESNGNVYAKGKAINTGIIVKTGTLEVNGKIASKNDIYTEGANSHIKINGDVYCSTFKISENASNSSLLVGNGENQNFRVFTKDDLELNGKTSSIEINGSYYGFSSGTESADEKTTHDESSAIIINTEDIGDGSRLKITGTGINTPDLKSGIIIGGTAYLELSPKRYQTGESVSIHGNYLGYTKNILNKRTFDIDAANGKKYEFTFDNSNFGSYDYNGKVHIDLVDSYMKNGAKEKLQAKDKGLILSELNKESPKPFDILTGWGDNKNAIELSNILYTTGAYITKDEIKTDKLAFFDNYTSMIQYLKDEYSKNTNAPDISNDKSIDKQNNNEICYVDNSSTSIALVGSVDEGQTTPAASKTYRFPNSEKEVKGIIITAGDVYISGEITFRGIIATKGDVIFTGSKQKNIYLDSSVEIEKFEESVGIYKDVNTYRKYSDLIETSSWDHK